MTMPTTTVTGTARRLEGGWFERLAWVVLVWLSLGFLAWVPFLYVGIRRGLSSDWVAFGSFALYEVAIVTATVASDNDDSDAYFGGMFLITLLMATGMLLFAMFDKKAPAAPAYGAGHPSPNPYQHGYPYGR
ncbi:hypothetical protein ABT300_09970 [Streptomyces sp. NPDC001027]|uniref:hypothetical protein n=1 Tax=Streptomyces sp. NPDC001027 TaxID=3154771 RepID=UPI0033184235